VTNPNPGYILSDEILSNKINHPKHNISYPHKPSGSLNDLDLFTKGQPISLYKELREKSQVLFHDQMPTDPEPGNWVLTS